MSSTLYALLIGINDYPNVNKLNGCVADVQALASYFKENFSAMNPQIKTLTDAEATREQVIDAFRTHLGKAKEGDTVYFHFSGHGSRENAPEEFWRFFPEKKNETMVCYDSRLEGEGHYDLADKELAVLLAEISVNKPHIVVCMDSCHSGSATRNSIKLGEQRQAEKEGNSRSLSSYLDGYYQKMLDNQQKIELPLVPHIALAACRPSEVAWETVNKRGLFTSTLLEVLEQKEGKVTYAELFRNTRVKIRQIGAQEPQFDLYGGMRAFDYFLTQEVGHQEEKYPIYFNSKTNKWQTDKGALQGISTEYPELIRFQVFKEDEKDFKPEHLLTEATVSEIKSNISLLNIEDAAKLDKGLIYTGLIANLPPPSITLHTSLGADEQETLIPSGLYEVIAEQASAEYIVTKDNDTYEIQHSASQKIIAQHAEADFIKESLRKIALWENTRKLENSKSKLKPEDIEVALYLIDDNGNRQKDEQGNVRRLLADQATHTFSFTVDSESPYFACEYEVTNHTPRDLFIASLIISPLYGIIEMNKKRFPAGSTASMNMAQPNEEGILTEGQTDMLGFWPGTEEDTECTVQIKYLITTEEEIDTSTLIQEDFSLNKAVGTRDAVSAKLGQGRFLGAMGAKNIKGEVWFTKDIFFRLNKAQQKINSNETLNLPNTAISIKAPEGFSAEVQVGGILSPTRSLKSQEAVLGQLFAGHAEASLFSLGTGSRSTQNQSLIELSNIQGDLSEENPLTLEINAALGEDEMFLPLAFDGEDIIPIGWGESDENGKTNIFIEEIPEEQVKSKSIGRALKFCLYKLASPLLKTSSNEFFQLRAVEYTQEGEALYESDLGKIAEKVQATASGKILLLIHGIIGNTAEMVDFAHHLVQKGHYDLILTFDYENLNTSIKDIAQQLKRRLIGDKAEYQGEKIEGIGISANHKIDILAHSMGGLVSRWMIEQLDGNAFVNQLVMCGTPNGGSNFGKINEYRHFASIGLALAVNGLLPFSSLLSLGAWAAGLKTSAKVLGKGSLLFKTLAEMNKGKSVFLDDLNVAGKDSGIPYQIIAADVQKYQPEAGGVFSRIYEKVLRKVGDFANSKAPNDVAVLLEDIKVKGQNQQVKTYDITGHHLNYFTHPESVDLLMKILSKDEV